MFKSSRLFIIAVPLISSLILSGCGQPAGPQQPGKYAEVAKCLTQKGVIMYGAYWCPHCAAQKEAFAGDFQFIKYQECDDSGAGGNHAACLAAGVTSYPTWFFPGQGNLTGQQPIYLLGKLANCEDKLPPEDLKQLKDLEAKADQSSATTPSAGTVAPGTTGQAEPVGQTTAPATTTTK